MVRLNIKPLSLNNAYRGRRFKTPELEQFKRDIMRLLPPDPMWPATGHGKLSVRYVFGVSSKNSDGDNLIKVFQDALADCYGFNDKRIYEWHVKKVDVPKGSEFIEFDISTAAAGNTGVGSL
jgi:Holliday junction resolvase RusA-like endonuclease